MPILSFGSFTARVAGVDSSSVVKAKVAAFTYYPIGRIAVFAAVVFFVLMMWQSHTRSKREAVAFQWVLLPGLTGVAFLVMGNELLVVTSIPLMAITASLVIWWWRKVRGSISAAVWAFLGITPLSAIASMFLFGQGGADLAIPGTLLGFVVACPLIAIRVAIWRGVTWGRLLIGAGVGVFLPLGAYLILFAAMGVPLSEAVVHLLCVAGFLLVCAVPFCALLRWNSWAREVTAGTLFARDEG